MLSSTHRIHTLNYMSKITVAFLRTVEKNVKQFFEIFNLFRDNYLKINHLFIINHTISDRIFPMKILS